MRKEIKHSEYLNKELAFFDENGKIPEDGDGKKIYIVEKVYLMEANGYSYICFLLRRKGTNSHGQAEWEEISFNEDSGDIRVRNFMRTIIEKNQQNYRWI